MAFVGLKSFLNQAVNRAGIDENIKAAGICDLWDKIIFKMFDKIFIEKCKAISFKKGELTVAVLDEFFIEKLETEKYEIIEALNKEIGKNIVDKIKFEV
ncbi:MAG: DciA family protein [bacterium]|nr:DciA family protein [bacterium]